MSVKFNFKRLGQKTEVEWPVTVAEPIDGGKVQESVFTARFHLLTDDETKAAQAIAMSADGDPNHWVNTFFVGLGKDEEPLTPEMKALMVGTAWIRTAIVKAYMAAWQGAPAKN